MTTTTVREQYRTDGVVFLPQALDADELSLCEAAYEWSLANPGPGASSLSAGEPGRFMQDLNNPAARSAEPYRRVLEDTRIGALVADLWGERDVWFMYEQVFLKEGGETRRTPWHQDASYLPVDGEHLAVLWITFDPVDQDESLELVRGSHQGTLYNTSRFDPADETAPIFEGLPRLPNIESDRDAYDIVSWSYQPGDVLAFHPRMLHGGAPTHPGKRRRTLSLRFFGPDAVYRRRPGGGGPFVAGMATEEGQPFRHDSFPKVSI